VSVKENFHDGTDTMDLDQEPISSRQQALTDGNTFKITPTH